MTNKPPTGRDKGRAYPAAAIGLALLALGLAAWVWTGDWRWALTGLLALFVIPIKARPRPARTPHEAEVENAVSAALTEQYGFLPLDVRYGAAKLAREHVEAWHNGKELTP